MSRRDLPPPTLTDESLERIIRELPSDSAPGPSGWSFALLKQLCTAKPGHRGNEVLGGLKFILRTIAFESQDWGEAGEWIRAARLLALKKEDDGGRPIAVGEALARVLGAWILTDNPDYVKGATAAEQFGVGSPGWVEPVIFDILGAYLRSGEPR